jgi:hypothetical protein
MSIHRKNTYGCMCLCQKRMFMVQIEKDIKSSDFYSKLSIKIRFKNNVSLFTWFTVFDTI